MKIKIISGSPRKNSITFRLALHLKTVLGEEAEIVRDYDLPFVQEVWSKPEKVPAKYKELGEKMFAADGIILISPEYNGGYSPALKNLLDHFPKQSHKVFGIAVGTDGALGAMRSAQQLIQLVAALFGILSPQLLITPQVDKKFNEKGELLDENFQKAVDTFVKEYVWLLKQVRA